MSDKKHTPGPWLVGSHVTSCGRLVYIPIITHVKGKIACAGVYGHLANGRTAHPTGNTWPKQAYLTHVLQPECEANAQLIAAAPDLLAACKAALKVFQEANDGTNGGEEVRVLAQLRAALKKAGGV